MAFKRIQSSRWKKKINKIRKSWIPAVGFEYNFSPHADCNRKIASLKTSPTTNAVKMKTRNQTRICRQWTLHIKRSLSGLTILLFFAPSLLRIFRCLGGRFFSTSHHLRRNEIRERWWLEWRILLAPCWWRGTEYSPWFLYSESHFSKHCSGRVSGKFNLRLQQILALSEQFSCSIFSVKFVWI